MSGAIWAIFTKDSTSLENQTLAVDNSSRKPSHGLQKIAILADLSQSRNIQDEIGSICSDDSFTVCLAPQRVHSYSLFDCVPLSDNRVSTRSSDI